MDAHPQILDRIESAKRLREWTPSFAASRPAAGTLGRLIVGPALHSVGRDQPSGAAFDGIELMASDCIAHHPRRNTEHSCEGVNGEG